MSEKITEIVSTEALAQVEELRLNLLEIEEIFIRLKELGIKINI